MGHLLNFADLRMNSDFLLCRVVFCILLKSRFGSWLISLFGMVSQNGVLTHEMLPYALLAYRTSIRTSTGAIPYSLVYGMEAVLPIKVEIPSMRILAEAELEEAEWAKQWYEQLNFIDEKRLKALCHGQCYQQRMARAFNARVRHCDFNPGDLVLRKVLHVTPDSRGKFSYKYNGPFVVKEVFSGGAVSLSPCTVVIGNSKGHLLLDECTIGLRDRSGFRTKWRA
ncbi:hypothetical protein CRG98_021400 [Punica granatum]|uniref:Uncharacterized protein n=1 Tax=Punica granatum TaxID=22663 RepID=A0A2I0JPI0_PUNGR|nr:hypothetical protein CRG98_021400 [Punica granatum]